jgi:VanZ family protein
MAVIFYLTSQSNPPVPGGIPDWMLHGVEYFGFAALVFRAVSGGLPAVVSRARVATTMAIVTTYAISDEVHQLFVPYRTADVRDVRSDIVGASIALVACWAWHIIATPRAHVPDVKSRH